MKLEPRTTRDLLIRALPEAESLYGGAPRPQRVYFPPSREGPAPRCPGGRGNARGREEFLVGRSAGPCHPETHRLGGPLRPDRGENRDRCRVWRTPRDRPVPDKDTLRQLMQKNEPRLIWRTIAVYNLLTEKMPRRRTGWNGWIGWQAIPRKWPAGWRRKIGTCWSGTSGPSFSLTRWDLRGGPLGGYVCPDPVVAPGRPGTAPDPTRPRQVFPADRSVGGIPGGDVPGRIQSAGSQNPSDLAPSGTCTACSGNTSLTRKKPRISVQLLKMRWAFAGNRSP